MIDPRDIDTKQFGTTRLKEGYDQNEVDDFLDLVAADFRAALTRAAALEVENARLKRTVDSVKAEAVTSVLPVPPASGAERILVAAQRTADQVEADANAEAGRIRAAARAEADNVKATAEGERQSVLNRLETERAELEEKIQLLKAKRSNYKGWLRAALTKLEEEEAGDA
ncbi:DivIVA domain-containing protein [Streptomyces sp. S1]|uniref:DivIVA domain-containing protein n=1 Tax=Streptomyces sp. S1 TaxID=718288 RepID=UPI003D7320D2